ncbi:uncharacterized protein JCM15063_001447 [Sporobolomyces koalae]|uniref:uncharacterized protein n=1 Tax=Sporobolomyces koalae TaxID=500713 RepID=UPI00317D8253
MEQARYLEGMPTGARGYEVVSEFIGINGLPIISEVPGIDIPRSFSMELMHLLFENVMKDLRILWTGKLGTTTLTGDYPFVISQDDWDLVDVEVENASRDIPSEWGKKMPAPGRNQGWFTAEDYANFLNYVGPAVLHKRLQEPYYSHFLQFRSIALKLLHPNIPRRDINQGGLLSEAIVDWVTQYEELYFGGNAELLPVMTSAIHALLHVCEYTRWLGPLHLSWSFVVERYCQHAEKFVTSKFSPYASLALSVLRLEQMKSVKRRYPAVVETATEVAKRARPAEVHEDGFSFTGRRGFDRLSNHIFIRKAVETMFPALDRTASSEIEIARFWEFRKDGAEDVVEIQRPDALAQTRTTPIIRVSSQ